MYSNIQTVNYAWRYTVLRNTVLPAMIPSMFLAAYIFHFSKLFSTCLLKGARFDKDILDVSVMKILCQPKQAMRTNGVPNGVIQLFLFISLNVYADKQGIPRLSMIPSIDQS